MPTTRFGLNLCKNATITERGRGFSLLELVMVMVVMAIVAGIGVPRMAASTEHARVNSAVDRIESMLDEARVTARTRSCPVTVSFDAKTGIVQVTDRADKASLDFSASPYRAQFTAVSIGGDAELVINGFGTADSGGTITLSVGSAERTITLLDPPKEPAAIPTVLVRSDDLVTMSGVK